MNKNYTLEEFSSLTDAARSLVISGLRARHFPRGDCPISIRAEADGTIRCEWRSFRSVEAADWYLGGIASGFASGYSKGFQELLDYKNASAAAKLGARRRKARLARERGES